MLRFFLKHHLRFEVSGATILKLRNNAQQLLGDRAMVTDQDLSKLVDEMYALLAATPITQWDDATMAEMSALIDMANKLKRDLEAA
jgi:hypothetical protein